MRHLPVALATHPYEVVVGEGALDEVAPSLVGRRRVAVVTQEPVVAHAERIASALGDATTVLVIDEDESAKNLATVERLCRGFATAGLLRADAVVAVGGGVVGDTAGFAAASYHRGIDVVQVPTTLLAQVDAAIGGKTAVNLPEGKNLVGAFHQPIGVFADTATLATLPDREFRAGLGEVVKYALMGDRELATILETQREAILARDAEVLTDVVARCAATKIAVVVDDEQERSGARATLNYGHTLAHALETLSDYELSHGEAVAVGLVFAGALAAALERVDTDAVDEHRQLVGSLGLPVEAPFEVSRDAALEAMTRDKKSSGGLTFVLAGPDGITTVTDPPRPALDAAFAAVGIS